MSEFRKQFVTPAVVAGVLMSLGVTSVIAEPTGGDASLPVTNVAAATPAVVQQAPTKATRERGKTRVHRLVERQARNAGVPVPLAMAVVRVESNYNPRARGRAGEVGLMQIKPSTARAMGYSGSIKALYDPETNLRWGMKYLAGAYERAGGTTCGTILRYNAGHYAKRMNPVSARYCGRVRAYLRDNGYTRLASL